MLSAYFDCFSGISGDMTLGALVDLGVPVEWLEESLRKLPLSGFELSAASVKKGGIQAVDVRVDVKDTETSRNYAVIKDLIENSELNERVKKLSGEMFRRIGEAEAKVHGCALEKVHFHEVGGIDAIVDIVGTALGIDYLGIERVVSANVPVGGGTVICSHGELPVPAPATCEILQDVTVYGGGETELTTPTGAAIIKTLATEFGPLPAMKIRKSGYGAGNRQTGGRPNLLRILLGEAGGLDDEFTHDTISVIETNIDDMNPEVCGYVMEKLFSDGALDVVLMPVFMKKNRPGTLLQVLCGNNNKNKIINRILSETSSIGLRHYSVERRLLQREAILVNTTWGTMAVKKVRRPGGKTELIPEYEACCRVADKNGIPIREVYDTLTKIMAADRHHP
jgi:uncharacterized protein (TIGR00299 family) protein